MIGHKKIVISFFIVFFAFFATHLIAEEIAKVTAVYGRVDVLIGGKIPAVRAKSGMVLSVGDVLRTRVTGRAEILFKDGTLIRVAPRTRVDLAKYRLGKEAIIKLPRGKISLKIKKHWENKGRKFEVKTPIAVAGVRGTHFIVIHRSFLTSIAVIKGRVYTYNLRFPEKPLTLRGGQITIVSFNRPPSPPRKLSPIEKKDLEKDFEFEEKGSEQGENKEAKEGGTSSDVGEKTSFYSSEEVFEGEISGEDLLFSSQDVLASRPELPITENSDVAESLNSSEVNATLIDKFVFEAYEDRATLKFRFSTEDRYDFYYRLDGGDWIYADSGTEPVFLIDNVLGGEHLVEFKAVDEAGNEDVFYDERFNLEMRSFSGSFDFRDEVVSGDFYAAYVRDWNSFAFKGKVPDISQYDLYAPDSISAGGGTLGNGFWLFNGNKTSSSGDRADYDLNYYFMNSDVWIEGSGTGEALLTSDQKMSSFSSKAHLSSSTLNWSEELEGRIHYYDSSSPPYIKESPYRTYIRFGDTDPIPYPTSQNPTTSTSSVRVFGKYEKDGIWWEDTDPEDINKDESKLWAVFVGYESGSSSPVIFGRGIYFKDDTAGILKLRKNSITLYDSIYMFLGTVNGEFNLKTQDSNISSSLSQEKVAIEGGGAGIVGGGSIIVDEGSFSWGALGSYTLRANIGGKIEPWGIFWITAGGSWSSTGTMSFRLDLSGRRFTIPTSSSIPEYWVVRTTGDWTQSNSSINGYFLTGLRFGELEGVFVKEYTGSVSGDWLGMFVGSFSSEELQHASYEFSAYTSSGDYFSGLLGGSESSNLWEDGAEMLMAGEFLSSSPLTWYASITSWNYNTSQALTYDSGAYKGYLVGRMGQTFVSDSSKYNVNARLVAVYVNPSSQAGIIKSRIGYSEPYNVYYTNFFTKESSTYITSLVSSVSVGELTSELLFNNLGGISDSSGRFVNDPSSSISFPLPAAEFVRYRRSDWPSINWGVGYIWFNTTSSQVYSGTPGEWEIFLASDLSYAGGSTGGMVALFKGNTWGDENLSQDSLKNSIVGEAYGSYLDGDNNVGVFAGETIGVFDPSSYEWEAVVPVVWMETDEFLSRACPGGVCNTSGSSFTEDQQKLRKLGFPVVEVGRASFSGSAASFSVNMNDVIFFSKQSGEKPYIWATADVSGSFSGAVNPGDTATLTCQSGCSGSVNFSIQNWSTNTWNARVSGSPTLSGGSYTGSVNMEGIASGTKSSGPSGTFSGKGTGITR